MNWNIYFLAVMLSLLGLCGFSRPEETVAEESVTCMRTGLEILHGSRAVRKIKAIFVMNMSLAYYQVQFCRQSQWLCFATKIDLVVGSTDDVIKNVSLWTKLIDAITGVSVLSPYMSDTHEDTYGGRNEYFSCDKYFIIEGPTAAAKQDSHPNSAIDKAARRRLHRSCLAGSTCTRTCLHTADKDSFCHEIRLHCIFQRCAFETDEST